MSFPGAFFVHTATVETYLGSGPYGDTFAAPVDVACFCDDAQDVTVQGTTVAVTDQTKIYAAPSTAPTNPPIAGQFTTNSRIFVQGQSTRVIGLKRHFSGALGLPDHVEVSVN